MKVDSERGECPPRVPNRPARIRDTTMILKGDEITCVKILAELLAKNEEFCRTEGKWEVIGLNDENYNRVLSLLEKIGVIKEIAISNGSSFGAFKILINATIYARVIESQETKKQAMLRIDSLQKEIEERRAKDEAFREEIRQRDREIEHRNKEQDRIQDREMKRAERRDRWIQWGFVFLVSALGFVYAAFYKTPDRPITNNSMPTLQTDK